MDMRVPEGLLENSGKSAVTLARHRFLCIVFYKTLNNLNLSFMKDLFILRETSRLVREAYETTLGIPRTN